MWLADMCRRPCTAYRHSSARGSAARVCLGLIASRSLRECRIRSSAPSLQSLTRELTEVTLRLRQVLGAILNEMTMPSGSYTRRGFVTLCGPKTDADGGLDQARWPLGDGPLRVVAVEVLPPTRVMADETIGSAMTVHKHAEPSTCSIVGASMLWVASVAV
jgi:hypothetical protein